MEDLHFDALTRAFATRSRRDAVKALAAMVGGLLGIGGASRTGAAENVVLCHKGKTTVTVEPNAVAAHLAHGDTEGPCPPRCPHGTIALDGGCCPLDRVFAEEENPSNLICCPAESVCMTGTDPSPDDTCCVSGSAFCPDRNNICVNGSCCTEGKICADSSGNEICCSGTCACGNQCRSELQRCDTSDDCCFDEACVAAGPFASDKACCPAAWVCGDVCCPKLESTCGGDGLCVFCDTFIRYRRG